MKTASSRSVAVSIGRRLRKRMTPSSDARTPATITSPSTSSAFAKIEPMIEVWATTVLPAFRAKRTTKNSGRLPRVDWSTPVAPGPSRPPTCSVAKLTVHARPASARVASPNVASAGAPA